jgi:hypothetical protein
MSICSEGYIFPVTEMSGGIMASIRNDLRNIASINNITIKPVVIFLNRFILYKTFKGLAISLNTRLIPYPN